MALGFTLQLPGYFPAYQQVGFTARAQSGFVFTTVYPLFYKHVVVEFKVPIEWGACKFDVFRSESDIGPWRRITPTPVSGTFFTDLETKDFSKFKNGWYMVECVLPDGRRTRGDPTTWENKRSNWVEIRAQEITRREKILLQKFTGVRSLVFRRKTYGARCPNCWNPQTEQITKDHCKVCLGTSFNGGYFDGLETLIQYEPTPNDAVLSYQGKVEPNQIQAWTIASPSLEVFDLVLRVPDMRLYRIDKLADTELQTVQVRQIMILTELDKESIEFQLVNQILPTEYQ